MAKDSTTTKTTALVPTTPAPLEVNVPTGNKLVQFIETVTKDDLSELRDVIAKRESQLEGMKKLERVVSAALGEPKAPPKPKADKRNKISTPGESINDKRRRIAQLLSTNPRTGHDIITQAGIAPVQLKEVMQCEYFTEGERGWHLTPAGLRAFC